MFAAQGPECEFSVRLNECGSRWSRVPGEQMGELGTGAKLVSAPAKQRCGVEGEAPLYREMMAFPFLLFRTARV